MIGLIVVGHGQFATGLTSSLKMIAGENLEDYYSIEFLDNDPFEKLSENVNAAVKEQTEKGNQVLIATDLLGGSPFKAAMLSQADNKDNIAVLVGTNLGMLIEGNLMRAFAEDVSELAMKLEETGKNQVQYLREIAKVTEVDEEEDGI